MYKTFIANNLKFSIPEGLTLNPEPSSDCETNSWSIQNDNILVYYDADGEEWGVVAEENVELKLHSPNIISYCF
jgi:hypothetical protein